MESKAPRSFRGDELQLQRKRRRPHAGVRTRTRSSVSQRFGARGHIWIKVCQLAAFSSELLYLVDKCGLNRLCVQPTGEREAAQVFCAEHADPTASMVEDSAVTNKSWL